MRGFYFDLLATPRQVRWLRGALLTAGALALAGVVAYGQIALAPAMQRERQQVQLELDKLGDAPAAAAMKPVELEKAWTRARAASVQLGLPWQNFFVQLGTAAKGGRVAFISIEPDAQKGHVVLVAEARTLQAMLQFLADLQTSPDFSEVLLQSHAIDKTTPEKPVRFRVSATWRVAE
jgi:hypothetical protein